MSKNWRMVNFYVFEKMSKWNQLNIQILYIYATTMAISLSFSFILWHIIIELSPRQNENQF